MTGKILAEVVNEMLSNITLLEKEIKLNDAERFHDIKLNGENFVFYSVRNLTPIVYKFLDYIEAVSSGLCGISLCSVELEKECVRRTLALKWIQMKYDIKLDDNKWREIIDYILFISSRTYENLPSSINMIINMDESGKENIKDIKEIKILDVLATANYSYIEVDSNLNIIKYDCIDVGEIETKQHYSDIPDYLLPYKQYISNSDETEKIGVSLSRNGDIVIYNGVDLILSIRKNHWTIYDNSNLKNTIGDLVKASYSVGCNIYDLIWNLSYKRHGALIIVSDLEHASRHIINKESIIENSKPSELRYVIKEDIQKIDMSKTGKIEKKVLLEELASVDGAVVIDGTSGKVIAFGSIIETHAEIQNVSGARSTAARSAIRHGHMKPIKISSDGDIILYDVILDEDGEKHYVEFAIY